MSIGRAYLPSPVGDILIESEEEKIIAVSFNRDTPRLEEVRTPVIEQCILELEEYFDKGRKFFTVELDLRGSDFQKRVWTELLAVPYGKTAIVRIARYSRGRCKGHSRCRPCKQQEPRGYHCSLSPRDR